MPFHVKEPLKRAPSCLRHTAGEGPDMAAYTLPEGFTEFDMFTFGTALLVGGEWSDGD